MCFRCQLRNLSAPKIEGLDGDLARVARLIYDGKLKPGEIDPATVKKIANQLLQGFTKGYGISPDSKDLSPEQKTFLAKINENLHVFSGLKNYHELKEATLLLKTDDDVIRPFNAWFEDFKKINGTYNEVYQNAEYGNAIGSGQSAASWHDAINNGVEALTFQTAGDDRVRPEHAMLNGMTARIDDPILDTYYTPLDWGCRCEWVAALLSAVTDKDDFVFPDVPEMFQNNVGKTGIVFPDTHPYFDVSKEVKNKVIEQVNQLLPKQEENSFTPQNIAAYEKSAGVKIDREIFNYLSEPTKLIQEKGPAYYNPRTKTVNLPNDSRRKNSKWVAESSAYHEFGHAADFQNGYKKLDTVKELMSDYKLKYKKDFAGLTSTMLEDLQASIKTKDFDKVEQLTATLDTIMSLDKKYGAGHNYKVTYNGKRMDYFNVPGMKEAEFIAHAFENRFIGNPIFKKHMPDLYGDMIELTKKFKPK